MPRTNRPRGGRPGSDAENGEGLDRMRAGWRRTEARRDGSWSVQPVSADQATKTYRCPGCNLDVVPGHAHVVTWRSDGLMGEAADLAARRHWHTHCWKVTP